MIKLRNMINYPAKGAGKNPIKKQKYIQTVANISLKDVQEKV